MPDFTDDMMMERLKQARVYTLCILHKTAKMQEPGTDKIVWEHGRRNMKLNSEGVLAVVCPIRDESDLSGIGIFAADVEETKRVLEGDPGVQAGIFSYELHVCRGFPGNALP